MSTSHGANKVIEFLKNLWKWLPLVFRWLVYEPKEFWIMLLPLVGAFIIIQLVPSGIFKCCFIDDTLETRFRLTGLLLEVLGLYYVVRGLNETLKLFLGKHLLQIISKWFNRFPKFGGLPIIECYMNAKGNSSSTSKIIMTTSLPPNLSIEDRIVFLDERYQQIFTQVQMNRTYFENEIKKLTEALSTERSEREHGDKKSQQSLKDFAVGDVHLELIGVIWLFFGAIFATASTELAKLFSP